MDPKNEATVGEMAPLLTARQAAGLLRVHINTIRRWGDRGIIQAYRINRRGDRRFRRHDVARLLRQIGEQKAIYEQSTSPGGKLQKLPHHPI